ncbi:hypothetical protein IPM62_03260 [Candidatus Woesebacteria bacterium]|nr:MAG: hypothetical protein IPM62_03260 [Candidatus Woesebacteria bacterium]
MGGANLGFFNTRPEPAQAMLMWDYFHHSHVGYVGEYNLPSQKRTFLTNYLMNTGCRVYLGEEY